MQAAGGTQRKETYGFGWENHGFCVGFRRKRDTCVWLDAQNNDNKLRTSCLLFLIPPGGMGKIKQICG